MNDDRCYHVPTPPGQSVCTCLDERMFLRRGEIKYGLGR